MIDIASPEIGQAERDAVDAVLESGMLADGPEVRSFEEEFAAYCGVAHGVATSNGTTALHAALEAVGVGEGDVVVTSPFSFVASANAIRLAGATPVFVDIDPETYNVDPDALEALLAERDDVTAVVPVHLYGLAADMPRIVELAEQYDLKVVEDACQAHGAEIDGRRVGSFGDAACFSFYPTKNMTTGEGGMVVTDDEAVAAAAASYINHGRESGPGGGYEHASLGHNFRMTSIAAAIGRAQLEKLPRFNERRRQNAARLTERLEDAPVETPVEPEGYTHVYHQYTVRTDDREALQAALEERGVGSGVYYPKPINRQPAYLDGEFGGDCPEADRAAEETLSLPVHPALTEEEVEAVADAVRAATEVTADV
nr:DegT/DnrJ/EryC1/StrS family aminotransferase [Halobium salinum]